MTGFTPRPAFKWTISRLTVHVKYYFISPVSALPGVDRNCGEKLLCMQAELLEQNDSQDEHNHETQRCNR